MALRCVRARLHFGTDCLALSASAGPERTDRIPVRRPTKLGTVSAFAPHPRPRAVASASAALTSARAAHSATAVASPAPSPQMPRSTISTSTPKTSDRACASRSRCSPAQLAGQRLGRLHQQFDAMAAREGLLFPQRSNPTPSPLVERELEGRLERRLELVDPRHGRTQEVRHPRPSVASLHVPVQNRTERPIHHRVDQRRLAGEIAIGRRRATPAASATSLTDGRGAGLHERGCGFEHEAARTSPRALAPPPRRRLCSPFGYVDLSDWHINMIHASHYFGQ